MGTRAVRLRPEEETPAQECLRGSALLRSCSFIAPNRARTLGLGPLAGRAGFPCKSAVTEFTHPTGRVPLRRVLGLATTRGHRAGALRAARARAMASSSCVSA